MSSNKNTNSDDDNRTKPSFSAPKPAANINFRASDDDYVEETTRRAVYHPPASRSAVIEPTIPEAPFKAAHMSVDFYNSASSAATVPSFTGIKSPQLSSTGPMITDSPHPERGMWLLQDIPTLPEFHPLERTAVFVPDAKCSDVSSRISAILRDRSIEAVYEDDKAKVKCVTPDGVDFRVRLYRGRDDFSHGVIVEVQRRFGSSINFHGDTQAILDAAEGKPVSAAPPPTSFGGSSLPLVSDSEDSDYEVDGSSSLSMVAMMLNHTGYDSHHLAYQTLIPLTSASKMGRATARGVSKELLRSDSIVGAKVLALVMARNDEEDIFKLRTMALTVLANAIQATEGEIDLALREQLRPILIKELHGADKNPRNAQMAALCVEHLLEQDHDAAELHAALERALDTGRARHAGLRMQAQRCLDKMIHL